MTYLTGQVLSDLVTSAAASPAISQSLAPCASAGTNFERLKLPDGQQHFPADLASAGLDSTNPGSSQNIPTTQEAADLPKSFPSRPRQLLQTVGAASGNSGELELGLSRGYCRYFSCCETTGSWLLGCNSELSVPVYQGGAQLRAFCMSSGLSTLRSCAGKELTLRQKRWQFLQASAPIPSSVATL